MNDLSPEARRTLAQAKSAQPQASEALRARVKENVLRAVAASVSGAPPPGAARAIAKLPAWALPSIGALVVIGGIATFASLPLAPEQSQPQLPVDGTRTLSAEKNEERSFVAEETPSAASAVVQITQPHDAARDHDADLRAEMQLLTRAEAALRAKEPQSALSILDAHARQFSSGQLQGERDGLRLIAQCALGRDPKSTLARYLHEHADGVLQGRIRKSCARFLE